MKKLYQDKANLVAFALPFFKVKLSFVGTLRIPNGYLAVKVDDDGTSEVYNPHEHGFTAPRFSLIERIMFIFFRKSSIYFIRTTQLSLDFKMNISGQEYTLKTLISPDIHNTSAFIRSSMGRFSNLTVNTLQKMNQDRVSAAVRQVVHRNGEIRSLDRVRHEKVGQALSYNGIKLFTSEMTF